MKLKQIKNAEIIHHADDQVMIYSKFNKIFIKIGKEAHYVELPLPFYYRALGYIRIFRRILRLDKSSIRLAKDRSSIVITYRSNIYCYTLASQKIERTHKLRNCNTVMHMSIESLAPNTFILGEYGSNSERLPVPIYISKDGGKTWKTICEIEGIRHIHGVYHDPYTDHLWVATGDFQGECYLFEFTDSTFKNKVVHGDGSQIWRTVNLFFTKEKVVWIMDSQLETSHLVTLDRKDNSIKVTQPFDGPVWYIKSFPGDIHLAQTTVEIGDGVHSNFVHLYRSYDLKNWEKIASFPHDGLPLGYCKFAVISFANGKQSADKFYISCEAIKNKDGKSYECSLAD